MFSNEKRTTWCINTNVECLVRVVRIASILLCTHLTSRSLKRVNDDIRINSVQDRQGIRYSAVALSEASEVQRQREADLSTE